jgi:hypothetical protein
LRRTLAWLPKHQLDQKYFGTQQLLYALLR